MMRFQVIAPTRPAATTARVIAPGSTTPFPIVLATLVSKKNAAMKLKNAAQRTACCGLSTRVDTTVAMEFAASWKPLMKSKTSARKTRRMTSVISAIFQDDPLHDV